MDWSRVTSTRNRRGRHLQPVLGYASCAYAMG